MKKLSLGLAIILSGLSNATLAADAPTTGAPTTSSAAAEAADPAARQAGAAAAQTPMTPAARAKAAKVAAAKKAAAAKAAQPKCPRCVSAPLNQCGGVIFGLYGIYWRPSTPYFDYSLVFPTLTSGPFHTEYLSHEPSYEWGFKASVGYALPCTANDIQLTYTRLRQDRKVDNIIRSEIFLPSMGDTVDPILVDPIVLTGLVLAPGATLTSTDPALPLVLLPPLAFTPFINSFTARDTVSHYAWDLDFGQKVRIGSKMNVRLFGGLRYANLDHKIEESFTAIRDVTLPPISSDLGVLLEVAEAATPGTLTFDVIVDVASEQRDIIHQKSDFDGIGPRFGIETNYLIGGGIGIVGAISSSVLVGEADSSLTARLERDTTTTTAVVVTEAGPAAPFITGVTIVGAGSATETLDLTTSFRHPDETRIVPNVDAKIGLAFAYEFKCPSRGGIVIEGGYWVSHYWNAVDRLSLLGSVSPEFRTRKTTDLSFDGPYIGIQVQL